MNYLILKQNRLSCLWSMQKIKIFNLTFIQERSIQTPFLFHCGENTQKNLYDLPSKELLQNGEPQGEYTLRTEIAKYLYQSRGIVCKPEQIVIGSGTEQLLPMILRLLENDSNFALENPGYSAIPRIQLQNKAIPIPVDEDGLIVDELEKTNANVVYITPSHQFPTGAVLSATRRTQLMHWAAKLENRYIIEDDYDSEFRYTGKPIPALQGMDQNDKVIYLSTFTKSLMPSLRVAYFVLPSPIFSNGIPPNPNKNVGYL